MTTMAPAATETPTPAPTVRDDELLLVTAFADAHLVLVDPDEGEIARIEVGRSPWPQYDSTRTGVRAKSR